MTNQSIDDLIRILQLAISPVVLISGVGLLILSMTNRMSQLISRMRTLHQEMLKSGEQERALEEELVILLERSRLIRLGLLMFALSILLDSLVVIALFLIKLTGVGSGIFIAVLFSLSLLSVIGGVVCFILDIHSNLRALKIELGRR